jgi:hypothetical protein
MCLTVEQIEGEKMAMRAKKDQQDPKNKKKKIARTGQKRVDLKKKNRDTTARHVVTLQHRLLGLRIHRDSRSPEND